jgi:hypothetical protein
MGKRGPSNPIKRIAAFQDKVSGANSTAVLTVRKDRMVAQQNASIVVQYNLERNFKAWFAASGQPGITNANYLAFARKCKRIVDKHVSQPATDEVTWQVDLFEARGLVRAQLIACVLALFRVVVV